MKNWPHARQWRLESGYEPMQNMDGPVRLSSMRLHYPKLTSTIITATAINITERVCLLIYMQCPQERRRNDTPPLVRKLLPLRLRQLCSSAEDK